MLKKTTLAVLGFTASTIASAGMYSAPPAPTCTPGDVTVPCETKLWDIGIQALYLQPIYSARRGYEPASLFDGFKEVDPDWKWGYRVEGSYHYNTGSDITGTWVHYSALSTLSPYLNTFRIVSNNSQFPAFYSQDIDNRFDQVNLVLGQHVDMGLLKNARFYGGLQYAEIQVDATYNFSVPTFILNATNGVRTFNNSDFNGVGPVIGIDYSYDLPHNLSITANTAGSLLYGTGRYNRSDIYGNGLVAFNEYGTRHTVVPSLEAKLGANYAYAIAQGVLNIQGGYQVMNYFNALQTRDLTAAPLRLVRNSDFGLYGPYFGVKWLGNG